MFSHIHLPSTDLPRAHAFWAPLMAEMGHIERVQPAGARFHVWQSPDNPRPLFLVGTPFEGAPEPGNGHMVAFQLLSHEAVKAAYDLALQLGATDEGAPGLRPEYHADYYGAYFRDPDGNKVGVACHSAKGTP